MESDINTENDSPEPSKAGLARAKLKLAAHYAMLGFVPAISVLALIVALIANHYRPEQTQNSEYAARIDSLNAALSDTKEDLETVKVSLAREKSIREEERKKMDGQTKLIVRAISDLQVKSKISPTLAEQLQKTATGSAAIPADTTAVPASAVAPVQKEADRQPAVSSSVAPTKDKKFVTLPPVHSPAGTDKKHTSPAAAPKKAEKQSPQVKALRDAIEQFNKQ